MNTQKPPPVAFVLSALTGAIMGLVAIKMLLFPTITEQPSFINCFNFISPGKGQAMLLAAMTISCVIIFLSVKRSKGVVVFIEGAMIWTVAYLLLVGVSSAPYASSVSGVAQNLVMIGAAALVWLVLIRWVLRKEGDE